MTKLCVFTLQIKTVCNKHPLLTTAWQWHNSTQLKERLLICTLGIRESLRLKKTLKIIKSNHQPSVAKSTTKSLSAACFNTSRDSPLPWTVCSNVWPHFHSKGIFPHIQSKLPLVQLEAFPFHHVPCYLEVTNQSPTAIACQRASMGIEWEHWKTQI